MKVCHTEGYVGTWVYGVCQDRDKGDTRDRAMMCGDTDTINTVTFHTMYLVTGSDS